jgi:hypothetical protein
VFWGAETARPTRAFRQVPVSRFLAVAGWFRAWVRWDVGFSDAFTGCSVAQEVADSRRD